MIEEDIPIDPKDLPADSEVGDALLYDFSKFMTTLALLMLGGVLTLTQTADKAIAKPPIVAMIVVYIALAGVCALSAASKIARLTISQRKGRVTARHMLLASIFLLGMGSGGFLTLWWKTL